MTKRVDVIQLTDVLCIWAYVGQIRMTELQSRLGEQVRILPRLIPVFGDVGGMLERNWAERGGAAGYAEHVRGVASTFSHVQVHADAWTKVTPASSWPAHVFLGAIRHLEETGGLGPEHGHACARAASRLREAFFRDAHDVGSWKEQAAVAEELGLPLDRIRACIDSGVAHATVAADSALAERYGVSVSPSLILNEGRQRLVGNVGYRLVEANVRELLAAPYPNDASWC